MSSCPVRGRHSPYQRRQGTQLGGFTPLTGDPYDARPNMVIYGLGVGEFVDVDDDAKGTGGGGTGGGGHGGEEEEVVVCGGEEE